MNRDTNQHHATAPAQGKAGRWESGQVGVRQRPLSHFPTFPLSRLRAWLGALALLVVSMMGTVSGLGADSAAALEYKVKAGYLFNFAKFIEWPASAFPSTNSPFVIGVLDEGEASPALRALLKGKEINGRPVEVKTVFAEAIDKDIHILLVTRAAGKTPEDLRKLAGSASILMVGETDEFAERGGSIGFVREEESVRLTICLEHAAEAGLKVSSKLSSVAKQVKSKRKK